jgi:hypothetical protein
MDALAFAHERGQSDIEQILVSHGQEIGLLSDATPRKDRQESQLSNEVADAVDMKMRSRRERPKRSGIPRAHRDIIDHMVSHFGPVGTLGLEEIIPVSGVRINVIPARAEGEPLILFTTGMSDRAQTVPPGQEVYRYTELFIRLPGNWCLDKDRLGEPENFWPIKWLKQIAVYPHEKNTWLGGQFTIISNGEPPEPLAPNTMLSCMMLLCETEDLNPVRCRDGRQILLYSLFPLYTEERDLEKAQGLSALFDRLTACDIAMVVDPGRVNAIRGKVR